MNHSTAIYLLIATLWDLVKFVYCRSVWRYVDDLVDIYWLNYLILQPKWNDALLEMFRIDFVGNSPYISCSPSLYHHRLGHKDRFLILSSDGLYQYFTNKEAVTEVETFIALFPEGDPAQHLIEEVLFRAAKKAGKIIYLSKLTK